MSNGTGPYPRFRIVARENGDLLTRGCYPWLCYAATMLRLVTRGRHPRASRPLPFRLETGTFVSAVPESWLTGPQQLAAFLGPLSADPISFHTAAGRGHGRMARNAQLQFVDAPSQAYPSDFAVTAGLNYCGYGLISLRDVMRHFTPEVEGALRLGDFGELLQLPDLVLVPHGRQRVKYRCPNCGIEAWGRPGLHLGCNDCTRVLVHP
jgi:hypothetical protein